MKLRDSDFHAHLQARMIQRGISKEEVKETLDKGWKADDTKPGTLGKVFVFPFNGEWEKEYYEEKEVRVYYKKFKDKIILLTAKAKYGKSFSREKK